MSGGEWDYPALPDAEGNCEFAPHPDFRVPKGISGSGDYPGNKFLVTLGFFNTTTSEGIDFVTRPRRCTNLATTSTWDTAVRPATQLPAELLSVMNYMFQLGGSLMRTALPTLGTPAGTTPT